MGFLQKIICNSNVFLGPIQMNKQTAKACLPKNKQNMPAHNQGKILKIAVLRQDLNIS